jgi:hypothetical protein
VGKAFGIITLVILCFGNFGFFSWSTPNQSSKVLANVKIKQSSNIWKNLSLGKDFCEVSTTMKCKNIFWKTYKCKTNGNHYVCRWESKLVDCTSSKKN